MPHNTDQYTNGFDTVTVISKKRLGYLVKDGNNQMLLLTNLKGYRQIGDTKNIKDWYLDSIEYVKRHPFSALFAALAVFFGVIHF